MAGKPHRAAQTQECDVAGRPTKLRQTGTANRLIRSTRWIGTGAALLVVAACFMTLPWTFQRLSSQVVDTDSIGLAPRRYEATDLDQHLMPPVWAAHAADERQRRTLAAQERGTEPRHYLGTDRLGRDVLARLLAGGAISLTVGLSAAAFAVFIGTLYGSLAGYLGGRVDSAMMRIVDILFGLPSILLIVLLAVAVDGVVERLAAQDGSALFLGFDFAAPGSRRVLGVVTLLVAIGGVGWLTMARVIRGQVLSIRAQPFMEACRALGIPMHRQFLRHVLPNLVGPMTVYAALAVPAAMLSESFLSFLGIGIQEPLPSWGNMAADGLSELNIVRSRWWLLLWPCLMIAITLLGLNMLGEQLRARFDVRTARR